MAKNKKPIHKIEMTEGNRSISLLAMATRPRNSIAVVDDIYGFKVSEGFISDVTDKILPQIEE